MSQPPLKDVPPSAKLVYKVLEYNGALTQKAIVDRSMLSPRTVRDALTRLKEIDVVTEKVYIPDARQNLYELSVPTATESSKAEPASEVNPTE